MKMSMFKLITGYILVMLVSFIAIVPIYKTSVEAVRQNALADLVSAAEIGAGILDKEFEYLQNTANNIASDAEFIHISALSQQEAGACVWQLNRLQQKFLIYSLPFETTRYAHIAFQNTPFILTARRVFLSDQDFYGDFFQQEGQTREQWRQTLLDSRRITAAQVHISTYEYGEQTYLMYHFPLPYGTSRNKIFFTAYLDLEAFTSQHMPPALMEHGRILLTGNDTVLFDSADNQEASPLPHGVSLEENQLTWVQTGSGKQALLKLPLARGMFCMIIQIDEAALTVQERSVRTLMITYVLCTVLAGIALSILFSYLHTQQMRSTLAQLTFAHLLQGLITTRNEYREAAACLKRFPTRYRIVLLHFSYNEPGRSAGAGPFYAELDALIRAALSNAVYTSYIDCSVMAVLLNEEQESGVNLTQALTALQGKLPLNVQEGALFGISLLHRGMKEAAPAYNEAKLAVKQAELGGSSAIHFYTESQRPAAALGVEQIQKLSSLILAGEAEEAIHFLQGCLKETASDYRLPLYQLTGLLVNLRGKLPFPVGAALSEGPDFTLPYPIQLKKLTAVIREIAGQIRQKKQNGYERLKSEILSYIKSNYADSQLSAGALSLHFGINEKYISNFIKEQTGKSYYEYLEYVRLSQAARLLKNAGLPILEVARQCGFHSQNTFYKAFRRAYGVAPSVYRESHPADSDTMP